MTCFSAPAKSLLTRPPGTLVAGDIKAQTDRVLQNIKVVLEDQRLSFANVVKSTVFLTNLADFAGMNEVYARYFTADFPARSTVQVAALPKGASVEIEVVAHFDARERTAPHPRRGSVAWSSAPWPFGSS